MEKSIYCEIGKETGNSSSVYVRFIIFLGESMRDSAGFPTRQTRQLPRAEALLGLGNFLRGDGII